MDACGRAAVVAGHICLDIIPRIDERSDGLEAVLVPGSLVEVGPAVLSTGGAVSNTGLALHRLGVPTRLMGKVGDDVFGEAIRRILRGHGGHLADGMLTGAGEPSSYTVVLNPPRTDRVFLHCPGANDTFCAGDVPYDQLGDAALFHFGYPPLMRRFYCDNGQELSSLFEQVAERGVLTSLDMARPDPCSAAGRAPWREILERTLPHVDLFLPSVEEILFMLDPDEYRRLEARGGVVSQCDRALLARLADELLAMGTAVVLIKLGERGLYARTTSDTGRLSRLGNIVADALPTWGGRERAVSCFEVDVAGTTGCGDATIAGFLAGLLRGATLDDALTTAVAVGACTAEHADATSGIATWEEVQARIKAGWPRLAGGCEI